MTEEVENTLPPEPVQVIPKEVKFLRLNTGEDLISEFRNEHGRAVLKDPMKVVYIINPHNPSRMGVTLTHWVFDKIVSNQEFSISHNDILIMSDPNVNLTKYYLESIEETKKDSMAEANASGVPQLDPSPPPEVVEENEEYNDMDDADYLEAIEQHFKPPKPTKPTIH